MSLFISAREDSRERTMLAFCLIVFCFSSLFSFYVYEEKTGNMNEISLEEDDNGEDHQHQ